MFVERKVLEKMSRKTSLIIKLYFELDLERTSRDIPSS